MARIEIVPGSISLIKMTDEEYFSNTFKDYISNSKLSLINPEEGGSFEKYNEGFKNKYSESFELGGAIHGVILQPDDYEIGKIYKPSGKLGVFADKVYPKIISLPNFNNIPIEIINTSSLEADYYANKMSKSRIETALSACIPYWEKRVKYEETLSEDLLKKQVYLSLQTFEKYTQCLNSIRSYGKIQEILYPQGLLEPIKYYNEYAILCEVDVITDSTTVRLKLKAKLDNFTINHEEQVITLNDLKTTGKPVNFFMGNKVRTFTEETGEQWVWYDGSFQTYHYYRQMGMYLWLLQCAVKEIYGLNYKSKVNMLVVETIPDYSCKVYPVNGKQIKAGLDEFKNLLLMVAHGK